LIDAERLYSRFAADSLIFDATVRAARTEGLLLSFVRCSEINSGNKIVAALKSTEVNDSLSEGVMSLLAKLTFVGFALSPNQLEFLDDDQGMGHPVAEWLWRTVRSTHRAMGYA
jgi:hypothetical protein